MIFEKGKEHPEEWARCFYCQKRADGAMLTMGNSMAHDRCVVRKLNELLDPDYDGTGEPRQAISYTHQPEPNSTQS